MCTVIFNGLSNRKYTINQYSRETVFNLEAQGMSSMAYFNVVASSEAMTWLQSLGLTPITHIQINNANNEPIYVLRNINARITSIMENLQDESVSLNINIEFSNT